ncbi:hypothetical protein P152DRAFT_490141 [Eremomyces bilateralis CBS 781.70]|uniref:RAVE subunit 2/Rogdi n=1 Tax=Eremomyces bilateralis CBS 781.70 TaxID=1392243 RepID=A0A6G1FZG4_9PEZI|nr:uncharacterized protein P152DRAFT_490141 [Eremomyces bilateralis CBS 781.70]KAF1811060.1 hypothetical protein P152DRAFT_490141 [Eremomyces bilateralis CBS 781.70]
MSAAVWPPLSSVEELRKEEETSLARELNWLLDSLQTTLQSLKEGLTECAELLAPAEPGSTLALSSHRSESLKGFITRVGTRIVKGDIKLRLPTLPTPRSTPYFPLLLTHPHTIPQLSTCRSSILSALDAIDVSRWAGSPHDANFIAGQLRLLSTEIANARKELKGEEGTKHDGGLWTETGVARGCFEGTVGAAGGGGYAAPGDAVIREGFHHLNVWVGVRGCVLEVVVRTLQPVQPESSGIGGGMLRGLANALGGQKLAAHDEEGKVFVVGGVEEDAGSGEGREVRVREKVRVEAQDPALIAVGVKLGHLNHVVGLARGALAVVMGEEVDEEEEEEEEEEE